MVGHLLATVPCQGTVEFLRQLLRLLDQGIDHRLGILAVDLGQHHVVCGVQPNSAAKVNLDILLSAGLGDGHRKIIDSKWPNMKRAAWQQSLYYRP